MFSSDVVNLVARFKKQKPSSNFKRWESCLYNRLVSETAFLPIKASIRQRLWHVEHNNTNNIVCSICNTNLVSWNDEFQEYRKFCSSKCSKQDMEIEAKRKATNIERYGVENYTQSSTFNDERKQTYLERYGTDWGLQSDIIKQKSKQTTLEKYGTEHYTQSDDYKKKYKQTINEKYGVDFFSQRNISSDVLLKLTNKDWLHTEHYINKRTITDIANELLVDTTTIVSYLTLAELTVQRFENSLPERQIVAFLDEYNINTIVNCRNIITPKELDIYLPDYNIAIEYCGLYWHSTIHDRITPSYHKNKLDVCTQKGVRLITIFEDEWIHNQELVKQKILSILGKNQTYKVYARNTKIVNIDTKIKTDFFNKYHIQGNGPGSINIGLEYNDELVACMSFIQQKNGIFILNRYATSAQILGGFSKLLSFFKQKYEWNEIISFADLRWSQGNVYETNGFTLDKILPPDYYYVDLKNIKRIHKFSFRHKRLNSILPEYSHNSSELENTIKNNWYRIYHCGLLRYTIKKT